MGQKVIKLMTKYNKKKDKIFPIWLNLLKQFLFNIFQFIEKETEKYSWKMKKFQY